MTQLRLVLAPLVLLAICLGACASSGVPSRSSPRTVILTAPVKVRPVVVLPPPTKRPGIDDSYDSDDTASRKTEEHDDLETEDYGHPATTTQARGPTSFAYEYFAAAAAENGAKACTLLVPSLAQSIGGKYEGPSEPSYLHGKTCAAVMTKLFKFRHKLTVAENAGLQVTGVRVAGIDVRVLLAFKGMRERRWLNLESLPSGWKLGALLDSPYP